MYTGYLDAGVPPNGKGVMYFHYWCMMSARDAATDPVLLWYNGGPGASSLFGLLQEFGPVLLNVESYDSAYNKTKVPSLKANPWAWTLTHTVCAIDSPPPMGLSFCSEAGPGGSPTSCGPWTDLTVFAANHAAHTTFFNSVFPELKPNPTYIIGESYAGIYVPGFANAMMDDPVPGLNFRGFIVGDGFPGCKPVPGYPVNWCVNLDNVGVFKYPNALPGPKWDVEFFHGHSQMSTGLYKKIYATCSKEELLGAAGALPLSAPCAALIEEMTKEVGYFYPYNLLNACPVESLSKHGTNQAARMRNVVSAAASPGDRDGGLGSPCLGNSLPDWLLRPETLAAIGAPEGSVFISLDNGHGFNYTTDRVFVGDVYAKALKKGLRVLVYEGDTDACGLGTYPIEDIMVPLFESLANKTQPWRPWMVNAAKSILGGYSMEWNGGSAAFASIRGAGHLAPLNRPHAAFKLVDGFTHENSLPKEASRLHATQ
eukprot:gene4423-5432_t